MTPHVPGSPDTSLLFDVFAVNQAVARLLREAMRGSPLTPTEYAIYSAIFELESATPTQLAARLEMPVTTFVDQLRTIERRSHATRVPNATDRRSYRIVLTTAGLEAQRGANRDFERAHAAFVRQLGEGSEAVKAALRAIREAALRARESETSETSAGATPPSAGRAG